MPRSRAKSTTRKPTANAKTASASRKRKAAPASASHAFTCPECGKTFSRAASLGAHRNRAHGVAGRSTNSATKTSTPTASRTTRNTAARARRATIDRDALLTTLFPQGIPARESVIRELNAWLDQAERLARRA